MKQSSLKANAFYSILKSFLSLAFPIITFPYASRILLPEGIGKVNFANSIISYFVILAGLGINGYACREASRIKDNPLALAKFTKEIFIINSISTIVSYIAFICVYIFVPKLTDYRTLLLICSIKIFFTTFGVDWIYNAFEEFKYKTIRSFCFQILALLFLFLFVHSKEDIIPYAIFGLISNVGSNVFNLIHSRKFINFKIKTTFELTKHLQPIFIFWGISLVTSIYSILDTSMLGFFSSNIQVGLYSAATKISHMTLSMLGAIGTVLLPRLSYLIKENKIDSFDSLVEKSLCIMTILSIPISTGLFLLAKPIILILSGSQYALAIIPMRIITPIVFFIAIGNILGTQLLPVLKKERIALLSYILGASTNIILNIIFIPQYGAIGAAIGTVCAEFIVVFSQAFYLKHYIIKKVIIINLFQTIIANLIMVTIIIFIEYYFENNILQIFLATFLGIFIYVFSLHILRNRFLLEYEHKIMSKITKQK